LNQYASFKKFPPLKFSKKFQTSSIAHAKIYASDDSWKSIFNYFNDRSENFSQVSMREPHSILNNCKDLARIGLNNFFEEHTLYWEHPLEIGCGVDTSKTNISYGVCHISPPIIQSKK